MSDPSTATLTPAPTPRRLEHRQTARGADDVIRQLPLPDGLVRRIDTPAASQIIPPTWTPERFAILPDGNLSPAYVRAKRMVDVAGAVVLMVLLAPLMIVTYAVLAVTTRGRPLFAQERVGLCGRTFRMFKFRTMRLDAGKFQHLVRNEQSGPVFKNRRDPRVTRLGRVLRCLSIDETPQLFNVLRGEMSLVGPRPPVANEVSQYEPWQLKRLAVKPGLTCLWQVSGRCEVGFEDWVRMDLWYLRHQSLLTDLMLLARTPYSVLSRRGAY